jgi:hypothetical protein
VPVLSELFRSVVAVTFLLSAAWKLRHRADFDAVVAGANRRLRGHRAGAIGLLVAAAEISIGVTLIVIPASRIPAIFAVIFLIAFSIFLSRADSLANGCGCWSPAQRRNANAEPYVIRNALLAILAIAGAVAPHFAGIGSEVLLAAVALLPAWLVMEIPTVAALLRPPPGELANAHSGGKP